MKVTVYQEPELKEDYAEIHCARETSGIRRWVKLLRGEAGRLTGRCGGATKVLEADEIFYFESVDKKTFAYLEDSVWEVALPLKEIEGQLTDLGFVRISRSVIVNIYKIGCIRSDLEMRMLLELENGEVQILNRHYKKGFTEYLGLSKERLGGNHEDD